MDSKTEIVIHGLEEESDDVIKMSDMKPGQFGKIIYSVTYADIGIYVMRTQESDNFKILDMSGFTKDSSWGKCLAIDNDIRVKVLDALIEIHVLGEDGKTKIMYRFVLIILRCLIQNIMQKLVDVKN